MSNDRYVSPLSERYASKEMQYIFSPDKKFRTKSSKAMRTTSTTMWQKREKEWYATT